MEVFALLTSSFKFISIHQSFLKWLKTRRRCSLTLQQSLAVRKLTELHLARSYSPDSCTSHVEAIRCILICLITPRIDADHDGARCRPWECLRATGAPFVRAMRPERSPHCPPSQVVFMLQPGRSNSQFLVEVIEAIGKADEHFKKSFEVIEIRRQFGQRIVLCQFRISGMSFDAIGCLAFSRTLSRGPPRTILFSISYFH